MPFPIEGLKNFAESNMTAEVNIWRAVRTQDPGGGWSSGTWGVVETTKGRVSTVSGREAQISQGMSAEVTGTASLPRGTDLHVDDRLEIDGEFYEVNAILPRTIKASERVLVSSSDTPEDE